MSYNLFSGIVLEDIAFKMFHALPTVNTNSLSYLETLEKILFHINEDRDTINTLTEAVELFEKYIIDELTKYDQKIIDEVTKMINVYFNDGTLIEILNKTVFAQMQTDITNLENTVTNNKTNADQNFINVNGRIDDIVYKQPLCQITIAPSNLIYNVGESINSTVITYNITKMSKDISSIKLYRNNSIIYEINSNINLTGNITDPIIINSDTTYYLELSDGKTVTQSNEIKINFVYNTYRGLIAEDTVLSSSIINSLESFKITKSDLWCSLSPNNQKIVVLYPTSYGNLISIKGEINGNINEEITNAFTLSTLTINNISYNCYCSNNAITDTNHEFKFLFTEV